MMLKLLCFFILSWNSMIRSAHGKFQLPRKVTTVLPDQTQLVPSRNQSKPIVSDSL
ncbi:hypothetical protein V6Z11_A07G248700 [Gossypium hirsutum]